MLGKLYLIPVMMGEESLPIEVLPISVIEVVKTLEYYVAENEKTARKNIKKIAPEKKQSELKISLLNKRTEVTDYEELLKPCLEGHNIGLMSEAGCPGIADPGAVLAKLAHQKGIRVIPMVGPSSILMAMMASGFNGQSFAFNGYLPIDRAEKKRMLKTYEKRSSDQNQSQLFIETPYRNNKLLEDLIQFLQPDTYLCIATDITLPTEYIKSQKISQWKKTTIDLQNRPTIFILHHF